ncbi:MAG TPA: hypothetical protein VHX38_00255 [Pseudonocardiaceae bacterium]|jgi:hypothetical protein|nr:hypothetical protein [Pseudonocardiaceae bacterium]
MHALKLLVLALPVLLEPLPEEAGFVPHPTSTNPSATTPATTVIPRTRRKAFSFPPHCGTALAEVPHCLVQSPLTAPVNARCYSRDRTARREVRHDVGGSRDRIVPET